eukprot:6623205-Prymnesium_polylepis.1
MTAGVDQSSRWMCCAERRTLARSTMCLRVYRCDCLEGPDEAVRALALPQYSSFVLHVPRDRRKACLAAQC